MTSRKIESTSKPPRLMMCHCQKCDARWASQMQLVPDPEPQPKKRGRGQKKMVWVFPLESFDRCEECGSRGEVIDSVLVKTNGVGQVKCHIPGALPVVRLEENDLVQE